MPVYEHFFGHLLRAHVTHTGIEILGYDPFFVLVPDASDITPKTGTTTTVTTGIITASRRLIWGGLRFFSTSERTDTIANPMALDWTDAELHGGYIWDEDDHAWMSGKMYVYQVAWQDVSDGSYTFRDDEEITVDMKIIDIDGNVYTSESKSGVFKNYQVPYSSGTGWTYPTWDATPFATVSWKPRTHELILT